MDEYDYKHKLSDDESRAALDGIILIGLVIFIAGLIIGWLL